MTLNFWNSVQRFFDSIKDFFVENSRNPFLWVGIIIIGLFIFEFTYKALHKD